MSALRRILVPVDQSDCSRAALRWALELAAPFDAHIDVLHVFEAAHYAGVDQTTMIGRPGHSVGEYLRAQAKDELAAFMREIAGDSGRVRAEMIDGDPAMAIVAAAERYDLVVMGRHGRTGLMHLLAGSVTERVLHRTHRPILIVHRADVRREPSGPHRSAK